MGRKLFVLGSLALVILNAGNSSGQPGNSRAAGAPANPAAAACDQACLSGFVDQYLAALLKHDPSGLPVAADVKSTENTKPTPLGEGLWKTIKYIKFRGETVGDPSTGQVTYWGAVEEDHVSLLMLRLKIVDGKITEVESTVPHGSAPDAPRTGFEVMPDLQLLATIKPFLENEVPVSQRSSRQGLIAAANAYFDGIEHQPGNVPFAPGCNRIENGQLTTNNPTNSEGLPPLGCQEQFQAKLFTYVPRVRDRRFPVVDQARGLVVAQVVFDIPGSKTWIRDGKEVPAPPAVANPRNNILNELFKVDKGQIQLIQAFMLPNEHYGTPTGWN
jgi:hypothetical protein